MSDVPPEILAIIEGQRDALEKVAPEHERELLAIALEIQEALEEQLRRLDPERFTTQQTRVVLAQARAVADLLGAEFGERVGGAVEDIGEVAARIGRGGLLEQIEAWAPEFEGSVRRIAPLELAGNLLDEGLLEYYQTSRQTYGMEAIRKMRQTLARSILNGETINQTTVRLQGDVAISEARAERLVRTEQSFAMHRRQLLDAKEADLGLVKQLLATFDNRTGDDSRSVHEQVRELDEPFLDNEGRLYQHPPNRPNDREAMVFVPRAIAGASSSPLAALAVPSLPPDPNAIPEGPETVWDQSDLYAEVPIKRENESGVILRRAGYNLKRNQGKNAAGKYPDYQIDGVDFDCYAPTTRKARTVWDTINGKVHAGQAKRFVINLSDFNGSLNDLRKQFAEWPIEDLEQVLVIDKDGAVSQLFP